MDGAIAPGVRTMSGYLGQQRLHLIGFQFIGVVGHWPKAPPSFREITYSYMCPEWLQPSFSCGKFSYFYLHYLRLNSSIICAPLPRAARATKHSSETFGRLPPNFVSPFVHLQYPGD